MYIGEIIDDLKCLKYIGKNKSNQKIYLMQCTICGRTKEMKEYVIKQKKGITHKACGQGLKTKNKIFYNRWCSMRTRTTNDNYWNSHNYKQRGINSDEFSNFIDFYDMMFDSFQEKTKIYGEKIYH